jgi:hypothetical protein
VIWTVAAAAELLGIDASPRPASATVVTDAERRLDRALPHSVRGLLAYDGLVEALAGTYDARPGLPAGRLLPPADGPRVVDGDVVWLMTENQGVCVWGVPIDSGDDPPVVVRGDVDDGADGDGPTTYADNVGAFAYAWAWDQVLRARAPLLQAQAAELDDRVETLLASRLTIGPTTWGWPCRRNLRFGGDTDGISVSLWACAGQCDWFISGSDPATIERWVAELVSYSDLSSSLWSDHAEGTALLRRVRASS